MSLTCHTAIEWQPQTQNSQPSHLSTVTHCPPGASVVESLFPAPDSEGTKEFHILPAPHQEKKKELRIEGLSV